MNETRTQYFDCPEWPACECPDGTVRGGCPGKTITASSDTDAATGGPAGAHVDLASPAAPATGSNEAVTALRQRGEAILADMRVALSMSDDALWMIKNELGHRQDLIDGAFKAHIDMVFVQRDLRELVRHL